jgi:N-formylglutamate deformylase
VEDTPFYFRRGNAPVLVSMPHVGTELPEAVRPQLTAVAELLQDTDWHIERLYAFAESLDATVLRARHSRYAIDLNRPPDGASLYPGQTTTGLCPTETFRGEPLYPEGRQPDETEQARRLVHHWRPYHDALRTELGRLRAIHGAVLLWDAHSIASHLPRLFDGQLPDFNFGTADGASCAPALIDAVRGAARGHPYTQVLNGRFKGGYITRHYGAPNAGIHAIQLEMSQAIYMQETPPFSWLPALASPVQAALEDMFGAALATLPTLARAPVGG